MKTRLFAFPMMILLVISCGGNPVEETGGLNVLIVIIDTLRADHLGCYGYHRDVTPTLDSLAAVGAVWTEAQSQSSWTLPSTATILTGLTPREHGAGRSQGRFLGLSPEIPTLQLTLHGMGYRTIGIFNVVFLSEDFGFHRGFDHFDCRGVTGSRGCRRAEETVDDFLEELETLEEDENFMAVVHFYDPHIPYDPPSPFDTLYAGSHENLLRTADRQTGIIHPVNNGELILSDTSLNLMEGLYDGEIAYTDREIGRMLSIMRENGITDSTIVVVVSDHGEEFLEHGGIEHGRTLYQEVTHIPLILSGPGIPAGAVREDPASHVDILPTVMAVLGIEPESTVWGRNLLAGEVGYADIPASNLLWSEEPQASIRRGNHKIIWSPDNAEWDIYDLESDPMELDPMDTSDVSLLESVEYYWTTPPVAEAPEVSFTAAQNNQLRDLGYIR
ncbi:MAG: sulfatase-like hydrolase/transferase [Candidatus Aegiribacteria sp.]|nr:sulfatase-like hydrolase/transferase [Candidatus Aegiribacteria sp.]MBD3295127.1 sulfatase-like hydrolase/transferase [Candidatus Fermentibacteria bacterium]